MWMGVGGGDMTIRIRDRIGYAYDAFRWGEDPAEIVDLPDDLAGLAALHSEADNWVKAARFVQTAVREAMSQALGERAGVRFGNQIFRTTPDVSYRIRDEHRSKFFAWVCEKPERVIRLFNPNSARVGGLKAIADEWVDSETGEIGWDAFRDAFLETRVGEPKLTVMPTTIASAPKFLVEANEGEVKR